jgi:MioC protein
MTIGPQKITLPQNILIGMIGFAQSSRTNSKVHDYTQHQADVNYFIEPAEYSNQCYMTGQGKKIRPGDRILLQQNQQPQAYTVKQIDYYSNPSSMWVALLEKHRGNTN